MKSANKNLKIYPSFKNMFLTILSAYVVIVLACILISLLTNYLQNGVFGFLTLDYILIAILTGITIFFIFFTKYRAYYLLTPNGLVVQKYTKKVFYPYKDVVYIDDIRSRKEKKVYLYFVKGSEAILSSDKQNQLLSQLLLRCENTLTRVDFLKKFPNKNLSDKKVKKR